ncbi:FAD/NAD(P)-binding protein [Novosphingobium resinovorum]|uniref:FAD dependent oxidoreductase n=1 Tax=Novosphingobium resinovorum TaxID=158500 RepID=A0A031K5G2_9SPHN|nr:MULTISPECIES: FAD/NAD(P)-binding protein [Sphingomonadaceae]EJU13648.1 FAD dependent oxidoreductase [Sphingomonas sp. LH128]EZP84253.1 FAD dependent oxidoreductase [Novosphingobium resinovorum]MBF7010669.1 FAD/NAD(P)-binding protein [Novosphingobium sp. HR1a]WJM28669.1 FAD/NAD(P)-binding protein [Novosphingobium resinovorum]
MISHNAARDLPIAIVGGGFSGTLLAINLLRYGVKVALIERNSAQLAKGVAFGTRRPEHLLNVRASNMSAFPDDAKHFARWMDFADADEANRFVPRLTYGTYLRELLVEALAKAGPDAQVIDGEACSVDFGDGAAHVRLADGDVVDCRAVVLALGNFPPAPHGVLEGLPGHLYSPDPWDRSAIEGLAALDHVLVVGSGLTAADVVLSLESSGFGGKVTVLSRRGLKPLAHAESGPVVVPISDPDLRGADLVRAVRRRAEEIGWRGAVDALRPHTQNIWRRHSTAAQARFLRHLRPYWDIHRHRLAPSVAQRLEAMESAGRLQYVAGKLCGADEAGGQAVVHYRPRGQDGIEAIAVDRVFNCAGPDGDLRRVEAPVLTHLLEAGHIRGDAHGLGVDVDHLGRVRDAAGNAQDRLLAVGPITKGEAWEIVAVPDIRRQVWGLARFLADEHWVGGEGL